MKVTVDVTAEDIAEGSPNFCQFCPIARAIKRVVRGFVSVSVKTTLVFFGEAATPADLPKTAVDFIANFDAGAKVTPFSFELDIP